MVCEGGLSWEQNVGFVLFCVLVMTTSIEMARINKIGISLSKVEHAQTIDNCYIHN